MCVKFFRGFEMESRDRDQELREFLDNRENRIIQAWIEIEHRKDEEEVEGKFRLKRKAIFFSFLLAYIVFLLYHAL